MSDAVVRPLLPTDVEPAQASSYAALREAGSRYGWSMPELDEAVRERGRRRVAHLQRTDPDGCWVLEHRDRVVGVALATRRGPLWFLSLLTVDPAAQARRLGARLLDAALGTAEGATAGLIMASSDPKALRRYGLAGFALLPGYSASGPVDRALLPVVGGVRDGHWARDRERVDALGVRLRGAAYGPDLDFYRDNGYRLLVAADGFAVLGPGGLAVLGAGTPAVAADLLWTVLAEGPAEVEIVPLTGGQQWAVDVALRARLALAPSESVCTRGAVGPMAPYLPSGAYG